MRTTITLLRYLVIVIIVALFGGLAGWFFFVRSHQSSIRDLEGGSASTPQSPLYGGEAPPSTPIAQGEAEGTASLGAGPKTTLRLWRADAGPVAGFSFIAQQKTASSSHLYFALRANGNVFDADAGVQSVTRLTNTLIPKTQEALFAPKGDTALIRREESGSLTTLLGSFATPMSTTTF